MVLNIEWSEEARADVRRLDRPAAERVFDTLGWPRLLTGTDKPQLAGVEATIVAEHLAKDSNTSRQMFWQDVIADSRQSRICASRPRILSKRHVMSTGSSWLNPKLEVGKSKTHKKGVFARVNIAKGERLAIFGGDIMLIDEIDDLPERLQEYPMQIEERFVLGSRSALHPEDTDFFNHSCDPNAGFKGQIFLVAMRDIKIGEEVTFDYAMVLSESIGSTTTFEMECRCRARNCRKLITENDWKLPALRRKYDGYFSQYLQEKVAIEGKVGQRTRRQS